MDRGAREADALFQAAETGDMKALQLYFSRKICAAEIWSPLEETMLVAAAGNGHEKAVRFMLDNGVPPDALSSATLTYATDEARAKGHRAVVKMLEEAARNEWSAKLQDDAEVASLKKMNRATIFRFNVSVRRHMQRSGKESAFWAAHGTEDQERPLFSWTPEKPDVIPLLDQFRLQEVFARAARRVEDDKTLASLLPPIPYDENDAAYLEKRNLTALSALVRARIAPQVKGKPK